MKNYIFILLTALCISVFISCAEPKSRAIDNLEALAFKLENESKDFSKKDWEKAAEEYAKIEEELQKYDYSDEELKEIGRLKGKCIAAVTRSSATILKNVFHNYQMQMEGASEELEDAFKEIGDIFEGDSRND